MSEPPKVFISYSHDSKEHMDRVLDLSNRLREDGIDCQIDQYEESPPEGWPQWTRNQIKSADFVLIVCTEIYERRFSGKEERGTGLGAKWEGAILTQNLYDSESKNKSFIPLLFSTQAAAHIPVELRSATRYVINTPEGYEALYRRLTKQPIVVKPDLGKVRQMPPLQRKQDFRALRDTDEKVAVSTDSTQQRPTGSHQRPTDFVIITALDEERDALLKNLPTPQKLAPSEDDVRVYFRSDLPCTFSDGLAGTYNIVVLSLLGMGRLQAAAATGDAIRRWRPRYVIVIGIAGGIAARNVNLGDIIISDEIVDYELQKLTADNTQIRYEVHRADPRLLGAARNLSSDSWRELLPRNRPESGEPTRHIGPIASGDKVIAFGSVLAKYRDEWPMLLGVEMEAAGVATASFQATPAPGFFMVRGVSDLADENKDTSNVQKWRQYACDVAASYTVALLKSGPVTILPVGPIPPVGPVVSDGPVLPYVAEIADLLQKLADLVRRSGRAAYASRRALCTTIRINGSNLDFLTGTSDRDFPLLLINHLYESGNLDALRRLCDAIAPELHGEYANDLKAIRTKLA